MDEKGKKEQEQKEQERENFKRTGGMVTRKEFYSCFLGLAALILWRGGLTHRDLGMEMWNARQNIIYNMDSLWNDVSREIEAIPEKVEAERSSLFWNPRMEIANVNRKAGTFRLALQATPKEYRDGMEGAFTVACDDGESIILQGVFDEDKTLRAETELPICGTVSASAVLKENGTEKIQVLNDMTNVEEEITPQFGGYSGYGMRQYEKNGVDFMAHYIEVNVSFSDRLRRSGFSLGEGELEMQIDGRTAGTVPLNKAMQGGAAEWRYWDEKEGEYIRVEYGQCISLVFRVEDNSGAVYKYLLEDIIMTANGPESIERGTLDQNGNSRLTIE